MHGASRSLPTACGCGMGLGAVDAALVSPFHAEGAGPPPADGAAQSMRLPGANATTRTRSSAMPGDAACLSLVRRLAAGLAPKMCNSCSSWRGTEPLRSAGWYVLPPSLPPWRTGRGSSRSPRSAFSLPPPVMHTGTFCTSRTQKTKRRVEKKFAFMSKLALIRTTSVKPRCHAAAFRSVVSNDQFETEMPCGHGYAVMSKRRLLGRPA